VRHVALRWHRKKLPIIADRSIVDRDISMGREPTGLNYSANYWRSDSREWKFVMVCIGVLAYLRAFVVASTAAFYLQLSVIKCLAFPTTPSSPFPLSNHHERQFLLKPSFSSSPFERTVSILPRCPSLSSSPSTHSNWRDDQLTSARSNGMDGSCFTHLAWLPLESRA